MKNKKVIILVLLISILLLITNVYAWFIYNRNAKLSIESSIKSWDISFIDEEEQITETIEFNIESIYPGMKKQEKNITIKNNGEIQAELELKIKSIRVLDEYKIVGENCTEEELITYINNLPFEIKYECNKTVLDGNGDNAEVKIALIWEFEDTTQNGVITEKDQKDTELGMKAYEYSKQENAEKNNFSMEIQLIAKQKNT